jgi:nitrate reductase beta subunit
VLVDQERCRGWRYCVSGCPYKKVYFNWKTGRAEKCILCYPRLEAGLTTLCAHTCVGRIRYVGVILYDADRIHAAAAAEATTDLYPAQLDILLDPNDPEVREAAAAEGISPNVLAAAARSPVYKLAKVWRLALPLHPEFRTLPMVWYIPPLSPIRQSAAPDQENDFIDNLRIPVTYLANLLTAGDVQPVRLALKRLAAIRAYMRSLRVEHNKDTALLENVKLTDDAAEQIYRLLALARFEERFVLPTAIRERPRVFRDQGRCGFSDPL